MSNFWIDYSTANGLASGTVPVGEHNGSWFFADGACDAYDYFFGNPDESMYLRWEIAVLTQAKHKLSDMPHKGSVTIVFNGETWNLTRNDCRDQIGVEYDANEIL